MSQWCGCDCQSCACVGRGSGEVAAWCSTCGRSWNSIDPAKLWSLYLQLVNVEEAFKNLKGDLAIRPIFYQSEKRIEAHILISFLAYCLPITLTERLRALAPGLTTRSALEKFASMQMIDLHVPTTDGRELVMSRTTQPEPELQLLLDKLKLQLPAQPPPKITSAQLASAAAL